MDIPVSIETDPHDSLDAVNDFALNPRVRLCALENIWYHETLDYMDAITQSICLDDITFGNQPSP